MSPSINTTPSDDLNMLESHDTPGRRLRALRESRKLDIERVAAQLHLQRHVVESIEGDQYERLPAPVFVVGYLKNYARLLGADPAPIIAAYRTLAPVRDPGLGQAFNGSGSEASAPSAGFGRWAWGIGVLLIGLAAGMATLWIRTQTDAGLKTDALALAPRADDSVSAIAAPATSFDAAVGTAGRTSAPASQPESGPTTTAPPDSIPLRGTEVQSTAGQTASAGPEAAEPAPPPTETVVAATTLASIANTNEAPAEPDSEPEQALEPETDANAEDAAETEAEATAQDSSPEPTSTEVVLEFTGTSWVDVRGSNGRVALNGEMRSGDRRVLDGEPPYKLVIGNASATQLTIGGRPFDLKGRTKGNVARFSLDPNDFE